MRDSCTHVFGIYIPYHGENRRKIIQPEKINSDKTEKAKKAGSRNLYSTVG